MTSPALERSVEHESSTNGAWWRGVVDGRSAVLVLATALFLLAQLPDPAGYLSTDVGGKTATVEVMLRDGWRLPDLGYWAESLDPAGELHPMSNTSQRGDLWVNVTTLPMLLLSLPFVALGGFRLALALPVLGTVAAATAARRIAVLLGADLRQQRLVFWLVGLASPATIYALDFWEHSIGLALMLWGVVGVLQSVKPARLAPWVPFLSGLAYTAAASMRQEALVYGFIAGAVLGIVLFARGRLDLAIARGLTMAAGAVTGIVANSTLERVVLGTDRRGTRNVNTARSAGDDLSTRVSEAFESGIAPMWSDDLLSLGISIVFAGCLCGLALRAEGDADDQRVLWMGVAAIGLLLAADFAIDGLRFVPGLLATTPVAAFGIVRGWGSPEQRIVSALAIVPLPLVWAVQYTGGQSAQWGGRYILTTGALLVVAGVASCSGEAARRTLHRVAAGAAVMTLIGVAWTVVRTHAFADVSRHLAARDEPVVIVENSSLGREAGPLALDQTWLAASNEERRAFAVEVLDSLGVETFAFVHYDDGRDGRTFPGWQIVSEERFPLVNDLNLVISTWAPRS